MELRTVVNQMHKSPEFFDHDRAKHASGKLLFNCRIIPGRGSWLDLNLIKDIYILELIERKNYQLLLPICVGFNKDKIIETFYTTNKYTYNQKLSWSTQFNPENYKRPIKLSFDLITQKIIKSFIERKN